jgi:hypothetical protein
MRKADADLDRSKRQSMSSSAGTVSNSMTWTLPQCFALAEPCGSLLYPVHRAGTSRNLQTPALLYLSTRQAGNMQHIADRGLVS